MSPSSEAGFASESVAQPGQPAAEPGAAPAATAPQGMSPVTTLPAPMTAPSAIVTPFRIVAFAPIQQSLPMATAAVVIGWQIIGLPRTSFP